MRRKSEAEINAGFNATVVTDEEIKYIIKMRRRMTNLGYLLWIIIGSLIYLYWSSLSLWFIIIGVILLVILGGGLISFITGKIVESKTGHDLLTQIQIHKNYRQGKY